MVVDPSRLDEFLPLHALRAPNIAWFLGAGASAAAGIPTALDMVLDFKRTLYCAAQRVPVETVADLGDSTVRARLQRHFDDSGGFPPSGSDAEYAQFFEAAYPDEADRRRYIETHLSGGSPSYGHYALAAVTSFLIATAQFAMIRGVATGEPWEFALMGLGGAAGVTLSMAAHRKWVKRK